MVITSKYITDCQVEFVPECNRLLIKGSIHEARYI